MTLTIQKEEYFNMRMIERDDFATVRQLAKKYNMNVADFGRCIVRQSERSVGRAIRLTEKEYEYIKNTAEKNNMSAARFCALACHAYLDIKDRSIPIEYNSDNEKRTKRLEARIYNSTDETELLKIASEYSMKISALIRYCALHFDGKVIDLEGG